MVEELDRRIHELRFLAGIEKVEHVPYPTGDELWVRFNESMDMRKLGTALDEDHYELVRFGGLPSKLPSKLGELLWDGVSYVIAKRVGFLGLLTSLFGFEPTGVATIVKDMHSSQPIYITANEEGVKILYHYLGAKYTPPSPAKPPLSTKPVTQVSQTPRIQTPQAPRIAQQPKANAPIQTTAQPKPVSAQSDQTTQKKPEPIQPNQEGPAKQEWTPGRYRAHAWGKKVEGGDSKATTA